MWILCQELTRMAVNKILIELKVSHLCSRNLESKVQVSKMCPSIQVEPLEDREQG